MKSKQLHSYLFFVNELVEMTLRTVILLNT